jgi:hypothetical protein
VLEPDLDLVQRFADVVMRVADLPAARRGDVEAAPRFSAVTGELICTCEITGSTYSTTWDGTRSSAEAFADYAGTETAELVIATPHYAWLRASH